MNLQVIAGPRGDIRWVSGALPGPVHDKKAESAPRGALLYSRFSLDPPAIPGGAFLARFLPEEFSLVNRGVVALPPALCAACP
jgi:hypothetical protein